MLHYDAAELVFKAIFRKRERERERRRFSMVLPRPITTTELWLGIHTDVPTRHDLEHVYIDT